MRISRFPSIVDDVTVRLIAGGVLIVSTLALATGWWWLYAVLWWVAAMFVIFRRGARARITEPRFIERGQDSVI